MKNNTYWWGFGETGVLFIIGGSVKWYCGKQFGGSSKNSNTKLLYNPEISLLSIYLEKNENKDSDTCTLMFTAYSHQPKGGNNPKCSWRNKWVIKLLHVHTMEYFSFVKKMKF